MCFPTMSNAALAISRSWASENVRLLWSAKPATSRSPDCLYPEKIAKCKVYDAAISKTSVVYAGNSSVAATYAAVFARP